MKEWLRGVRTSSGGMVATWLPVQARSRTEPRPACHGSSRSTTFSVPVISEFSKEASMLGSFMRPSFGTRERIS